MADRFITVAIHTYEKAVALRALLESEGLQVEFRNVNIEQPVVSSGIRVRIREIDLPLALRIIENREIFTMNMEPKQADPSKPIIVPVDFSDKSLSAVVTAFNLAEKHRTSISLLHTYIDPYVAGNLQLSDSLSYEITDINTREQIEKTTNTQMRHFASQIKEMIKQGNIPAVNFKTSVVEGVPEDAISEYARLHHPFLIVMGTRGPERKELDMIGSVTAEVLDKCRFTVLALPEIYPDKPYGIDFKNILYFSNVDQQDILALDTLYRVFPKADAKVTIATLPSKKRPFMRNVKEASKALVDYCRKNFKGYSFQTLELSSDNLLGDVKSLQQERNFDLIVVPNKKKNVFSRLFSPTLAHKVLFKAEMPILVIPV